MKTCKNCCARSPSPSRARNISCRWAGRMRWGPENCLPFVTRERIERQCFSYLGKLRIGGDQPCPTLHGQLGGEGVRIGQAVFLFEGGGSRGAVQVGGNHCDGELSQLGLGFAGTGLAVMMPRNIEDFSP